MLSHNKDINFIYKTPLSKIRDVSVLYLCIDTLYFSKLIDFTSEIFEKTTNLQIKFASYKPIYFGKFKYVGKGFKLIYKKKKKPI